MKQLVLILYISVYWETIFPCQTTSNSLLNSWSLHFFCLWYFVANLLILYPEKEPDAKLNYLVEVGFVTDAKRNLHKLC